jgi:hypothetical protein
VVEVSFTKLKPFFVGLLQQPWLLTHQEVIKKAWFVFDIFFDLDLGEPVDLMTNILEALVDPEDSKPVDLRSKAEVLLKGYNLFKAIETRETSPKVEHIAAVEEVAKNKFFGKYQHIFDGYMAVVHTDFPD